MMTIFNNINVTMVSRNMVYYSTCQYPDMTIFRHSSIPTWRYYAIPIFRHANIPPCRYSAIPMFRYPNITPFRCSAIPMYLHLIVPTSQSIYNLPSVHWSIRILFLKIYLFFDHSTFLIWFILLYNIFKGLEQDKQNSVRTLTRWNIVLSE